MEKNKFNEDRYKFKGFNPRIEKGFKFRIKPYVITGANFREIHFLSWKLCLSWWYSYSFVWSQGWDACFRDNLYKDEILESTKVINRYN